MNRFGHTFFAGIVLAAVSFGVTACQQAPAPVVTAAPAEAALAAQEPTLGAAAASTQGTTPGTQGAEAANATQGTEAADATQGTEADGIRELGERRTSVAKRERPAQHREILLQARLVDRVRNRDHQVGHYARTAFLIASWRW